MRGDNVETGPDAFARDQVRMNYSASRADDHATRATKSGTRWSHKSVVADGDFVNSLNAVGYFRSTTRAVPYVVGAFPTDTLSDLLSVDSKANKHSTIPLPPVSLPCTHPDIAKPKPKPWRDTGEEIRGLFYHDTMRGMPNVRGFTLCLSDDVQRLARGQGKHCLAWLHKRVVRHLRATAGLPTPFWFAIELVVSPEMEKASRAALKSAGGNWERDGAQLRFSKAAPDFRWAGYCLKSCHKARPVRRRFMRQFGSPRRWVAGFEGKSVTATEGLRRLATTLHQVAALGMKSSM
jgi:hypothetical protein